jgi:OOP family OmpA-OmpF porin
MQHTKIQRILLLPTILLSLFVAPQVQATTDDEFIPAGYFGVGLTSTDLTLNDENLSQTYAGNDSSIFNQNGNAFKLFLGYQYDPLLGLELGYTSFGEMVMSGGGSKSNLFNTDGIYFSTTVTKSITKNITATAKAGMFFWTLFDNADDPLEEGQGITYGAGLDLNLYGGKERTLLVEWEHYAFSDVSLKDGDTIGVSLKFNY